MEFAIKELHNHRMLDDLDLEIIECYNCGYTHRAIAEELNKGKTTINQRLNKIFRRISKFYEKTENVYDQNGKKIIIYSVGVHN